MFLVTNDSNLKLIDLAGYSSKEAKGILETLGMKVKLTGNGYVTWQSVPPDTVITPGMEIELTLNPKFDANNVS